MSDSNKPTEPNMQPVILDEMPAPPRFLLWGVIIFFVLIVLGFFTGIWAFNSIFTGGQQQRIIGEFPFMETFLIRNPTPEGGVLPTVDPALSRGGNALDLLNMPLSNATATPEMEMTEAATEEPTKVSVLPTNTPLPTSTPLSTNTPLPTYTSEPLPIGGGDNTLPAQSFANVPVSHRNTGFAWAQQTWNNCGPATITTALTFFGWVQDQAYAKEILRPNREDKNVSPGELVNFVNEQSSVRAIWRIGGNIDLLRALIANGFPVVVERGMFFEAYDWIGHYQPLVAYDDSQSAFYAYDSFLGDGSAGEGILQSYAELDRSWRDFNRLFIVVYHPEREALLQSVLGDLWDVERSVEIAFETAQNEARLNQDDAFAWHNLGSSLTALGRYQEAATAFDRAMSLGTLPWRTLWYQFGLFEAYYHVGRYDDIIALAKGNLNQAPELEESYYWRGMAYAEQGHTSEAISDFRLALRYNPHFDAAQIALDKLQ
jgi:tetratricopeptide (TPR) repeat protein